MKSNSEESGRWHVERRNKTKLFNQTEMKENKKE